NSIARAKRTWNGHKEPGTSYQNFDNKNSLHPKGKNPGTVADFWNIPTNPGRAKHYAKFNTKLVSKPIIAGCPKGGIILDPFCGTSTTGVEAINSGRNFIGIDGKAEFIKISENNLKQTGGLQGIFNMQYQKEIIAEIDDSKRPVILIKVESPVKEKLSIDFRKTIAKRQFFGLFSRLYDLAKAINPGDKVHYMNDTVAKLFKYYQDEFKAMGIKLPVYESTADTTPQKTASNSARSKALKLERLLDLLAA
ncbi:MAG: DNA methyltransferase, partial [Bacteroidota bacterium]